MREAQNPILNPLAVAQPSNPQFVVWAAPRPWAALIAGRLPSRVCCREVGSATEVLEHLRLPERTVLLLADNADLPRQLYECVRTARDRSDVVILVSQQTSDARISQMLCEVGAHANIHTIGGLLRWLPVVHRFLMDSHTGPRRVV